MANAHVLLVLFVAGVVMTAAGGTGNATPAEVASQTPLIAPTATLPAASQATMAEQTGVLSSPAAGPTKPLAEWAAEATANMTLQGSNLTNMTLTNMTMAELILQQHATQKVVMESLQMLTAVTAAVEAARQEASSTAGVLETPKSNKATMGWCCFWSNGNKERPELVLATPDALAQFTLKVVATANMGGTSRPIKIPKPGGGRGGRHLLATTHDIVLGNTEVATAGRYNMRRLKEVTAPPPTRSGTSHTSPVHVPLDTAAQAGAARKASVAAKTR